MSHSTSESLVTAYEPILAYMTKNQQLTILNPTAHQQELKAFQAIIRLL
jgi:hypothetical protein